MSSSTDESAALTGNGQLIASWRLPCCFSCVLPQLARWLRKNEDLWITNFIASASGKTQSKPAFGGEERKAPIKNLSAGLLGATGTASLNDLLIHAISTIDSNKKFLFSYANIRH